jgi:hypothetical protein
LFLPVGGEEDWPKWVQIIVWFLLMAYFFLGVALLADAFMVGAFTSFRAVMPGGAGWGRGVRPRPHPYALLPSNAGTNARISLIAREYCVGRTYTGGHMGVGWARLGFDRGDYIKDARAGDW